MKETSSQNNKINKQTANDKMKKHNQQKQYCSEQSNGNMLREMPDERAACKDKESPNQIAMKKACETRMQ